MSATHWTAQDLRLLSIVFYLLYLVGTLTGVLAVYGFRWLLNRRRRRGKDAGHTQATSG